MQLYGESGAQETVPREWVQQVDDLGQSDRQIRRRLALQRELKIVDMASQRWW